MSRPFILLTCYCLLTCFTGHSSAESLLNIIRNKFKSKNAIIKNRDGGHSDFQSGGSYDDGSSRDSDLKLPDIPNAIHYPIYIPSSGGSELNGEGDSSWAEGSNIYTSSSPMNPLMAPMGSDDAASASEWASRTGHMSNPFLEVYDEQQLIEQKKLLRRRLQASKERESLRHGAIRAHDYTDEVTNNANAYEDNPRYKLPLPPGPPKYDDDHDDIPHLPSHRHLRHRSSADRYTRRGYMDDNPTSASSRMQLKTMERGRSVDAISPLSAFTSAEALAAFNLLNAPPPHSSRLSSRHLHSRRGEKEASGRREEYDRVSGMTSHPPIESEHTTRGISRRSNRVNIGRGSFVTSTVTGNVSKNSLDHPYFSSVLKKDKEKSIHDQV